ncbi:MAG: hypothetical protein ACLQDV_03775 [Candidatus Binataceae bacterium]
MGDASRPSAEAGIIGTIRNTGGQLGRKAPRNLDLLAGRRGNIGNVDLRAERRRDLSELKNRRNAGLRQRSAEQHVIDRENLYRRSSRREPLLHERKAAATTSWIAVASRTGGVIEKRTKLPGGPGSSGRRIQGFNLLEVQQAIIEIGQIGGISRHPWKGRAKPIKLKR